MSEEVQAEVVAPEQVATAAPEADVSTPEAEQPKEPSRVFTQEELDAAIGKRLAREQRKWEREQAAKLAELQAKLPPDRPVEASQFESPEAYAEALAQRKAEELLAKRDAERQHAALVEAYHDREEEARAKYSDFEQVAYRRDLPVSEVMAETIRASDIGPEIAYHLGHHPDEAARIFRLSPFLQAKEIGKLEAKLTASPPTKPVTSAPPPIAPVTAKSVGAPVIDTTDPRSIQSMTTSQWIEAERQRQIRKHQAQYNR